MPLQFNQTKNKLAWSIGGKHFTCYPWESVDVPAELIVPSQRRGVPIAATPAAAEVRAARRVEDEKESASNGALASLKRQAEEAKASERAAREHVESMQAKMEAMAGDLRKKDSEIADLEQRLAKAESETKAAEALLSETAKEAAESEERALKAEALREEIAATRDTESGSDPAPKKRGRPPKQG